MKDLMGDAAYILGCIKSASGAEAYRWTLKSYVEKLESINASYFNGQGVDIEKTDYAHHNIKWQEVLAKIHNDSTNEDFKAALVAARLGG